MAHLHIRPGVEILKGAGTLKAGLLSTEAKVELPRTLGNPVAFYRARSAWRSGFEREIGPIRDWPSMYIEGGSTEYQSLVEFSVMRQLPGILALNFRRRIAIILPLSPHILERFAEWSVKFDLVVRSDRPVASFVSTSGERENWNIVVRPEPKAVSHIPGQTMTWGAPPVGNSLNSYRQSLYRMMHTRPSPKITILDSPHGGSFFTKHYIKTAVDKTAVDWTFAATDHADLETRCTVHALKDRHSQASTPMKLTVDYHRHRLGLLKDAFFENFLRSTPTPDLEEAPVADAAPGFVQVAVPSPLRVKPRVLYGPVAKRKHWEK